MPLSVIGAGFGRTGTMSLKLALEKLGFGPCYHMSEVFKNDKAPGYWEAAADGKPVDWEEVFAGYRSTVDWPSATFYKELADAYPEAKVVLTIRDAESWFASTQATIFAPRIFEEAQGDWGRMVLKVVGDLFDREMSNKAKLIDVYQRHNETVQRVIPPERLLVYDLSQGWDPLCRFLEVGVPNEPIPSANSTEDFKRRLGAEVAEHAERK
jgi:Sulfotransferase domain